jgi:hypothetical protein
MGNLSDVLTILNAAGIPVLAAAVLLLIRAFRQQAEIYKGSTDECKQFVASLQAEIQRLRTALESTDLAYLKAMEKVRELSDRSGLVATALSEAAKSEPADSEFQFQVGEAVVMVARLLSDLKVVETRLQMTQSDITGGIVSSFYQDISRIFENETIRLNPHARWALAVILSGGLSDEPLDTLVSKLRAEHATSRRLMKDESSSQSDTTPSSFERSADAHG